MSRHLSLNLRQNRASSFTDDHNPNDFNARRKGLTPSPLPLHRFFA